MRKKSYVDNRIKKSYTVNQLEEYLKNQIKRNASQEKIDEIKVLIEENNIENGLFIDGLMKSPLVMLAVRRLIEQQKIEVRKLGRFNIGYIKTKRESALLLYTMIELLEQAKKKFSNLQDYVSQKTVLHIYSELPKGLTNDK